jgi:hypothetical protein
VIRDSLLVAAFLVVFSSAASAQDVLEQVAELMDDAVLQIHRSSRKPKPEKPAEHIDKALESQREVLKLLDAFIEQVEKAPG